jgi:hypothetical protein
VIVHPIPPSSGQLYSTSTRLLRRSDTTRLVRPGRPRAGKKLTGTVTSIQPPKDRRQAISSPRFSALHRERVLGLLGSRYRVLGLGLCAPRAGGPLHAHCLARIARTVLFDRDKSHHAPRPTPFLLVRPPDPTCVDGAGSSGNVTRIDLPESITIGEHVCFLGPSGMSRSDEHEGSSLNEMGAERRGCYLSYIVARVLHRHA